MEGLKPYPAYKESGLPWLGRVPAHWVAHCLRTLTRIRNERNRPNLPLLSVVREKGVILRLSMSDEDNHNFIPDDLSNYKVARAGNLVINKMKAWQGSMGIAPCDGIVSPAYYVFDFGIANRDYGQALLRSRTYVDHFDRASDGVRIGQWDLSIAGMRQIPIPVPPVDEQAAIVRFLDYATHQLDKAIRAKRKIIALLNEQKQAIIHRAVTRGLDPDVPLKDSGIPWLGQIPTHWEIVRNLALFSHRIEQGISGMPVLQVSLRSGITQENLDQFGRPKRLIADHTRYKLVRKHDLAYNTMRMWQGAVGASTTDGLVSPAYVVVKPRMGTESSFYELVFRTAAYKQQVNRHSTGIVSDRNRLYWESFKQMPNVSLPMKEQAEICRFIQDETGALNTAITRIEREISLLREYRTRLIADVVTGKLDVREAAARLPELTPEIADEVDGAEADEALDDFAEEAA
ncbi:MAG: restriction endonuclease subunit S [Sulfuritalea sp.]|nr:restriction endonuclease subunit S [Sulfuritalea sp.]